MSAKEIAGYFGPSLKVRGTLAGKGDLAIDGRFDGVLSTDGDVVVGERGIVQADASVGSLAVRGALLGDVHAKRSVHIASGGRIEGDVRAASIAIDDGAQLDGGVEMDFDMPDDGELELP